MERYRLEREGEIGRYRIRGKVGWEGIVKEER